jgi:CheY-like chemotaxis protein
VNVNFSSTPQHGGHIRLTAELRGRQVLVRVRDNGIGIPAAALPTIFDMFSQVDRSVERSTGGLGIGLALVKGLVEMHGGVVSVESPGEDKGTTFTVQLPMIEAGSLSPMGDVGASGEHGPGRRVLVVDDNRDGAVSLAMTLRLMGDEIRTAHDGLEAVEVAEKFLPHVILMDVGMPRLNGWTRPGVSATRLGAATSQFLPWPVGAKTATRLDPAKPGVTATWWNPLTSPNWRRLWVRHRVGKTLGDEHEN